MKTYLPVFLLALVFIACNGGNGPTAPTTTTTTVTALNIHGSVTTFQVVPAFSFPTDYRDVNYVVTTESSHNCTGCFVKVKWLDADGVQVDFTYAATDATISQGASTITNQDYMHKDEASRIKDSRIEYTLCNY